MYELKEIFDHFWNSLETGAEGAKSDFHIMYFGTISNGFPRIRTVVNRRVDRQHNSLFFHTDARSTKVDELRTNKKVSLLFYSKDDKVQLRAEGDASLHFDDELADRQWTESHLRSRRCYLALKGPGQEQKDPAPSLPIAYRDSFPDEKESEKGRENFCVVKIKINYIDWLYLKSEGHVRAKFEIVNGNWHSTYLTP